MVCLEDTSKYAKLFLVKPVKLATLKMLECVSYHNLLDNISHVPLWVCTGNRERTGLVTSNK